MWKGFRPQPLGHSSKLPPTDERTPPPGVGPLTATLPTGQVVA